jgi:hypothetical protein
MAHRMVPEGKVEDCKHHGQAPFAPARGWLLERVIWLRQRKLRRVCPQRNYASSSRSPAHLSRVHPRSRASIEIACRRQLRVPSGLGRLLRAGPLGGGGFQRLPSLDQTHPECPVVGIACRSGKAAAFIGSSPEFFQNHVAPLCRPAQYPFSGPGMLKQYQILNIGIVKLFARKHDTG